MVSFWNLVLFDVDTLVTRDQYRVSVNFFLSGDRRWRAFEHIYTRTYTHTHSHAQIIINSSEVLWYHRPAKKTVDVVVLVVVFFPLHHQYNVFLIFSLAIFFVGFLNISRVALVFFLDCALVISSLTKKANKFYYLKSLFWQSPLFHARSRILVRLSSSLLFAFSFHAELVTIKHKPFALPPLNG